MAIIDRLAKHNFINRTGSLRPSNFSYEGLAALYDELEQQSEETEQDIEFDPIAICCEYVEYANLEALQSNYSNIESLEDLEMQTCVIKIEGTDRFIIRKY